MVDALLRVHPLAGEERGWRATHVCGFAWSRPQIYPAPDRRRPPPAPGPDGLRRDGSQQEQGAEIDGCLAARVIKFNLATGAIVFAAPVGRETSTMRRSASVHRGEMRVCAWSGDGCLATTINKPC